MAAETEFPPMPTVDPDVHLRVPRRKKPRTLKGDIKSLKGRVSSAVTKWGEGKEKAEKKQKEVRGEAKKILAPAKEKIGEEKKLAGEVMKPVYKAIETVKTNLDPANGKTRPYVTSFMISSVVSWVAGPQILIALYERIRFGSSTTDWGILNGPGRWFRDTMGMAYESGRTGSLIWAAIMGLLPMVIMFLRNMAAGHLAQSTYQGRLGMLGIKWLTRSAYLVPIGFFVGVSYPAQITWLFGSPWTFQMWQFWVAGLFCLSFYCTMWVFDRVEKGLGLGYTHVLLMTPLASVITGAALYAPGAAW
ncbi:membrane protein [Streptomyces phage EhyElimayoE]|nr:membrane protein [Streptomyces phage EhyElimayoE]